MDSCLQRLKVRLQELDWLDEEKNIKVSQSEAGRVHSFAKRGKKRYRWRDTDDSQIRRLRPTPPSPPQKVFTDLHDSREWPISRWKLWISPKGDKFAPLIIKLERARAIFNITLIGFVWKKKVIYTYKMSWGWVKHWLIFIFGWTNPLIKILQNIFFFIFNFHFWVNYPFKASITVAYT